MKIPGFIDADPREANLYLNWVRGMLGVMGTADVLYWRETRAIRRIAKELWRDTQPWDTNLTRLVYRGVRLSDPDFHGKSLPPYKGRPGENVASFSFTEDVNVACHFADPDPETGFGAVRELPPHGYVIEMKALASDVLFHWSYLDHYPIFRELVFAAGSEIQAGGMTFWLPEGHVDWLAAQREVTIRNHTGLIQPVKRFPDHYPSYRPPGDTYPKASLKEDVRRRIRKAFGNE